MKPLAAYLCVLSWTTSSVIIIGSWLAQQSPRPGIAPRSSAGSGSAGSLRPEEAGAQGVRSARAAGGVSTVPSPDLRLMAASAAGLCGVPVALFEALISRESSWRQTLNGRTLRSSSGALGLTQVKASTAREVSPTLDPHEPFGNLLAGACYLRKMFDRRGDWREALLDYRLGAYRKLTTRAAHDYADDILSIN